MTTENDELNEALANTIRAVEKKIRNTCGAESAVPMPEIAQRLHKREFYQCGRKKGHEGNHYWPGHGHNLLAEWSDD